MSREHQIVVGKEGMVTIAGGKLPPTGGWPRRSSTPRSGCCGWGTAYRVGSVRRAPTRSRCPARSAGPADDDHDKVAQQVQKPAPVGCRPDRRMLADSYGMRAIDLARRVAADPEPGRAPLVPGRPEILGQVDWAVREELAARLLDVMIRRTQLYYRDHEQGLGAASLVGRRMAGLLGGRGPTRERARGLRDRGSARSRRWRFAEPCRGLVLPQRASPRTCGSSSGRLGIVAGSIKRALRRSGVC